MYGASTKNATPLAISAVLPRDAAGILDTIAARTSVGIAATISVLINPGHIQFTVTPYFAVSSASDLENPIKPALAAA